MPTQPGILFTAFEPSGDALAGRLIGELKKRCPQRPIYALGGPLMQQAGAELIEATTGDSAMLLGAVSQAWKHRQRVGRLRAWLADKQLAALVPTDSPAANWSICKLIRKHQPAARIVHLAAPQLWAWAPWRIGRLRRLSDHVLCLFPFEPKWFSQRGVEATFVGHPLFEAEANAPKATEVQLPVEGEPKLALLPGSRRAEITANWPVMLEAYKALAARYPGLRGVVAASDTARAEQLTKLCAGGRLPQGMTLETGSAAAVLAWADVALVKSGTSTLQCLAHKTPMVIVYVVSRLIWHLAGRWVVQTRTFSLPNLLAKSLDMDRIVPELIPHFGAAGPLAAAVEPLMVEGRPRQQQREAFAPIAAACSQARYSEVAPATLLGLIDR